MVSLRGAGRANNLQGGRPPDCEQNQQLLVYNFSDCLMVGPPGGDGLGMTATPLHEMTRRSGRPSQTVSEAVVDALKALGVSHAFGVSGGAIAPLWGALSASEIKVVHFRHETGAAFAAIEAHFATNAPVVVFTTTGPGLTNVLTGMLAARGEGAKIILVSACTTAAHRGRGAIQETDSDTMPLGLTAPGALFHSATVIELVELLPQVFRRVANGLARPGGFVCHLSVPTGLQTVALTSPMPTFATTGSPNRPDDSVTERCAALLTEGPVALWLGYGVVVQTLEVEPIRGLEVALDHAASTAFQISGAVLCLTRNLSSLN